jgi:serine/threonine protein kinase
MIHTNIGNYKITRLIGEGGMAKVYEAEHEMLGTKVAIKVLNPILSANLQIKERFKNEAKLLASLEHPNIMKVIDFDEQPQQLSIVMEYLNGEDLNQKIKTKGPLSDKEVIDVFSQTLSAFQYAHSKGIVHRDIKPSNIFVLNDGRIKILDFGIAKLFGDDNEMTQTGTQIGTPIYMSPEQVKADKTIDHRSDIYSLGVTMFYAVNGKPPYDSNTTSQFEIFNKIVFEALPEFTSASKLNELIKKACAKDREQRFESCQIWLNVLKEMDTTNTPTREKTTTVNPTNDKTILNDSNSIKLDDIDVNEPLGDETILESMHSPTLDKTVVENQQSTIKPKAIRENLSPKQASKRRKWIIPVVILILVIIPVVISIFYAIENKDSDYDGVIDKYDNCIDSPGDIGGCPDSDSDGFPDYRDDCPDVLSENNNGCPDSDNDGVVDSKDDCPEDPGMSENGCTLPGKYVFWFDANYNGKWEGPVQIYIDGEYQGEITEWYNSNPGCGANGCVTVYLAPGYHKFSAKTGTNTKWSSQELEFFEDQCNDFRMWIN